MFIEVSDEYWYPTRGGAWDTVAGRVRAPSPRRPPAHPGHSFALAQTRRRRGRLTCRRKSLKFYWLGSPATSDAPEGQTTWMLLLTRKRLRMTTAATRPSCSVTRMCMANGVAAARTMTDGGLCGAWAGAQFTISVCDSIGAAESYSVSVSCVGSPCSWHWFDRVPAPQSQKNLCT